MQRPPMRVKTICAVVLAQLWLVHAVPSALAQKPKTGTKSTQPAKPPQAITPQVQEMLDLLATAIQSKRIDDLKDAIDWNEMKPDFGTAGVSDPVAHWKAQSKDGSGQETLDTLAALLEGPPAIVLYGKDLENNRLFVWPGFAENGLKSLSPADAAQFSRLVPTEEARAAMSAAGRYTGWRLVLGADGTWHAFRSGL
jgi:hypothetical protein